MRQLEQGVDERVRLPVRLEHPLAGVGHVDARRGEQVAHLGRVAQVGALAAGGVAQTRRVALAADPLRRPSSSSGRAAGGGGDEVLGRPAVDRQPVALELEAQHGRRGLGVCGGHGPRSEVPQLLLLAGGQLGQGRGDGPEPGSEVAQDGSRTSGRRYPSGRTAASGSAAVPAGGRAAVEEVEQVVPGRLRRAVRVQPVRARPDAREIGPPAAVQEPVDLRDVPASLDPYAGGDERPKCVCRGGDQPPRVLLVLQLRRPPDHGREVADDHRSARLARSDGGAAADDHQGEHDPHPTRRR